MGAFNGMPPRRRVAAAPAPDRPASASADRAKLIRAVHAACRKLGLDDEARRDVQIGATGKASLAEMAPAEINRVLAQLNRRSPAPAGRPHVGKIRALWWSLYWLGVVHGDADKAIDAFVRRQTDVDALRFVDHRQAHRVIEALKGWAAREGVQWAVAGDDIADRAAVLDEIERRLACASSDRAGWAANDYDAAIRAAGKRLRARTADR